MRTAYFLVFLAFLLVPVFSIQQSHPISHITPIDSNLNMAGFRILNVASPVDDTDVATKGWVITQAGGPETKYITTTRAQDSSTSCGGAYPAAYCPSGWTIVESWNYCIESSYGHNDHEHNADYTETLCSRVE